MIALLEAHRVGLLRRQHWLPNIISGVIVGVVALPLAMAFAIASGAQPEQGLYTAIVAGFLGSALGGSRLQISGPTGAFIVILAGITAKHGIDGLQIATLMAGVMLLLLGLARMGTIIKFIPDPVILGFTAGIGVIIWVGQWQDFFGLPAVAGHHFHVKLWQLLQALPQLHPTTTALAVSSLLDPKLPAMKRVPGPLVALAAATRAASGVSASGARFTIFTKWRTSLMFHATTNRMAASAASGTCTAQRCEEQDDEHPCRVPAMPRLDDVQGRSRPLEDCDKGRGWCLVA